MIINEPLDESEAAADLEERPIQRRGRPRVTDPNWDKTIAQAKPDLSRRSHVKHYRIVRALRVFDTAPDEDFSYLVNSENVRMDILAELGMIENESDLLEAAVEICKQRMKTKEAVTRLRQIRNGKSRPGKTIDLADEILGRIDNYMVRHPSTTKEQVLKALC